MSHLGDKAGALVDGQLGAAETERAHAHLAQCRPCRDEVAAAQAVKALVSALDGPAPGADLVGRLLSLGGPQGPLPPRAGHVPGNRRPRQVPVGATTTPHAVVAGLHGPVGAGARRVPDRPGRSGAAASSRGFVAPVRPGGPSRPPARAGRVARARAAMAVGALSVLGVVAAAGWTASAGVEPTRVQPVDTAVVEQATTGVRPLSPPAGSVSVNWTGSSPFSAPTAGR